MRRSGPQMLDKLVSKDSILSIEFFTLQTLTRVVDQPVAFISVLRAASPKGMVW
eukprot:COSAG06_NODE_8728_length_2086_cov_2.567187_2_plen_54_part_00